MKKILIILLFITYCSFSKENPNIELPNTIKTKIDSKQFNKNSLWGYINGGADLYLEYGFDELKIYSFDYNDERIKVEIYKMQDNESAFGIFSINHYNCLNIKPLTQLFCSNNYNVQFAKGNYYISIINETGDKDAYDYCIDLAKKIITQIKNEDFSFPELFNKKEVLQISDRIRLFKGLLGLQNINLSFSELLKFDSKVSGYFTDLNTDDGIISLLFIKFNNQNDLSNFLNKNDIKPNEEKTVLLEEENLYMYNKILGNLELILLISDNINNLKEIYNENLINE